MSASGRSGPLVYIEVYAYAIIVHSTHTKAFDGALCLYNIDTLNICMKEFGLKK